MHISFFIGDMVSGGAERVIQLLSNHFVRTGWKVDIVLLLSGIVNKEQFPLDDSISVIDLSQKGTSYSSNAIKWLAAIRKYVINEKPDCIVSFIGRINALVLTSTLGINIPIIVSERNDPKHDGRGIIMREYCNFIYNRAKAIVFQTQYEKSCFSSKLEGKSFVIENPVMISKVDNIEENPLEISTAGRLVPQKNHALLIEAISLVAQKYPNVRCEIYGEGEQRQVLENIINKLELSHNVHLPGNKTDIYKWIAKSSVFVLSSEYEGLSNALIEAMMLGKACISTDYPGVDEVIENGVNGIIVARGDSEQLAEKIDQLISDSTYRNLLAANAQRTSHKYETDEVVKKWKHIIEQCCNINE